MYTVKKVSNRGPIEDRLKSSVFVNQDGGCWNWLKAKNHSGYGLIRFNGKQMRAHRVSYLVFIGEIPDGMIVMHSCDNQSCINPSHLFLGTPKENTCDMLKKGREFKKVGDALVVAIRGDSRPARIACSDYGIGKTEFASIRNMTRRAHV